MFTTNHSTNSSTFPPWFCLKNEYHKREITDKFEKLLIKNSTQTTSKKSTKHFCDNNNNATMVGGWVILSCRIEMIKIHCTTDDAYSDFLQWMLFVCSLFTAACDCVVKITMLRESFVLYRFFVIKYRLWISHRFKLDILKTKQRKIGLSGLEN